MWTDGTGISTVLGEEFYWYVDRDKGNNYASTRLVNLHFTQFDAGGTRVFDTVLPKRQVVDNHLTPSEVAMRFSSKDLFRGVAAQESDNQLSSVIWWKAGPAVCVLYNDALANIGYDEGKYLAAVRNPRLGEAVICRFFPAERRVERAPLFGTGDGDETRAVILESLHFDAASGQVTALIVHTVDGVQTVRMAWASVH